MATDTKPKTTSDGHETTPDERPPQGVTHVLAATSIRSLADLEGERVPDEAVHPNGQPVDKAKNEVDTIPDPAVEALRLEHAPLSKDAETQARKK